MGFILISCDCCFGYAKVPLIMRKCALQTIINVNQWVYAQRILAVEYLHTMIRIKDLDASIHFFCDLLGMKEVRRKDYEKGRFTLIFLAAPKDVDHGSSHQSPLLELTYNWPEEGGDPKTYSEGTNFGHLAYRVENIYELCEKLKSNGITINRPPRDGYMAFIRSPDNISIELLQKGEPLAPCEPWASMPNTGSW